MWRTAAFALTFDLVSKGLATRMLTDVVYNVGETRFGMGWAIQLLLMVFVIIGYILIDRNFKVPDLGLASGLVIGGAGGNLASMMFGPPGVLDWIPLGDTGLIANGADFFIWFGVALTWYVVGKAAWHEARARK